MNTYKLNRTGDKVSLLLDKIDGLKEVTKTKNGIMSATDKLKLDEMEYSEALSITDIDNLLNF